VTPRRFPPTDLTELLADLVAEITHHRNLVPRREERSYPRTQKRPGGRFRTKKPADRVPLTPKTKIIFWRLPLPT
jgi:hypothetical protein